MKQFDIPAVYGQDNTVQQARRERFLQAQQEFSALYGEASGTRFFTAPGRTEVCGNHTDHNHGKVLAAGVSLDVIAAAAATDKTAVRVKSAGFPEDIISLETLLPVPEEQNTSAALIRGVAAGFVRRGYKIGGFNAYTTSDVLKGSGLSSSAAFEVLIGTIFNHFYNNGAISAVEIAQIAQFAENEFFGKPSGLMDQMASSVGGFITIDFAVPDKPVIQEIPFDFANSHHRLCVVDTHGDHADLTPDYASIPAEMRAVAKFFGKNFLSELTKEQVLCALPELRTACSDRAVLRALHFFDDNARVDAEAAALAGGDFAEFLRLVNASGDSSWKYLQNLSSPEHPAQQGLCMALYCARQALCGRGACRVHGGGFAGTIQAFVPEDLLESFQTEMNRVFGENSCHVLAVRQVGGTEVVL